MGAARPLKVRYTRPAAADLTETLAWIAARSPNGARRVRARIRGVINLVRSHPEAGRSTSRINTRVIAATPYPYLVFYTVDSFGITIQAVRHMARDLGAML